MAQGFFKRALGAASLVAVMALGACSEQAEQASTPAEPETSGVIQASFFPTKFFAERIGGGLVTVECPVPQGEDPKVWEPTREDIAAFQAADLIVLNGAEYEHWALTADLPETKVVRSASGIEDLIVIEDAHTHRHGGGEEHTHDGVDPHTWLDPMNAIVQAEAIAEAMANTWPEHAVAFNENLETLKADLVGIDAMIRNVSPMLGRVELLASHPAYNYLARRYGWEITNLDLDPEMETLTDEARSQIQRAMEGSDTIGLLLWESLPSNDIVLQIEELRVASVLWSPSEMVDPTQPMPHMDYIDTLGSNVQYLTGGFRRVGEIARGQGGQQPPPPIPGG